MLARCLLNTTSSLLIRYALMLVFCVRDTSTTPTSHHAGDYLVASLLRHVDCVSKITILHTMCFCVWMSHRGFNDDECSSVGTAQIPGNVIFIAAQVMTVCAYIKLRLEAPATAFVAIASLISAFSHEASQLQTKLAKFNSGRTITNINIAQHPCRS